MAAHFTSDSYLFTAGSASITFTPNVPAGASISQVFADVFTAASQPLSTQGASFTNLVDGNQVTTTYQEQTGNCATATKATVTAVSWTSGSETSQASVTVVSNATGNPGFVQYLVSYE